MATVKIESYKGWTLRSKRYGTSGRSGGMAWPGSEADEVKVARLEDYITCSRLSGKGAQQRVIDRLKGKVDKTIDSDVTLAPRSQ